MRSFAACALLAAALAGCGAVKVTPEQGVSFAPRPKGCPLEFLRKAPERAYQQIARLQAHVTDPPPGGAQEVLRDPACALGADAVIVTRSFVTNEFGHVLVAGTAIKYVEAPPLPPPGEGSRPEPSPGAVDL